MDGLSGRKTITEPTVRIRHEAARRRRLVVAERRLLAPNYLSIRFRCDDLEGFASAAWDDHVKVILAGEEQAGAKPVMRDYTPQSVDAAKGEMVIEFALHDDAGPATQWARTCSLGDSVEIAGPRGSVVISPDFDWYWMIGDESAIPAISRHMAECPASRIQAFIAIADRQEEFPLPASGSHQINWAHRLDRAGSDAQALLELIDGVQLPDGDGFVWIAAEATVAKKLREKILELGHPLNHLKARGYWVAGDPDSTASFD
jgi:NADPH-dependent ferric siderophore reductase